ncbi:MAG: peptidylprolyl isomerase [Clostridia bacterium]|nr:peptidylprolyl isomerase [Clostridia bacterium]
MKKLAVILLILALTASFLFSCSADTSATVLRYGTSEVTENMYTYWIATYKTYFLNALGGTDTEKYLTSKISVPDENGIDTEMTVAEYIDARIAEIINSNCISLYLFDAYKLELPKSVVSAVNTAINTEIENAGGRKALNEALAPIGLNVDTLREMYLADERISYLYTYLYGDDTVGSTGAEPISTEQYNAFYEKNYVCVRHIYIRTADKNVLNSKGEPTYDKNGNVITEELTAEEAAAKLALCDDLMARLKNGEDFLALEEKYSEDAGRHTLKDGYIISRSTALPDAFISAAFDMKIGELRRVDASYATHIMIRCALPELGWNNSANSVLLGDFKEYVKSDVYAKKIAPMLEKIEYDHDLMAKHTVMNTPITAY